MMLRKSWRKIKKLPLAILVPLLAVLLAFAIYNLVFWEKIYPGIYLAGIEVGGKTPFAAAQILANNFKPPEKIILRSLGQNFEIEPAKIGLFYDFSESAGTAYQINRTGNIFLDFTSRLLAPFRKKNVGLIFKLDEDKLNQVLSVISGQISVDPILPSLKLTSGKVEVDRGKAGTEADTQQLRFLIGRAIALGEKGPIEIPINSVDPTLTDQEAASLKARAEALINKSMTFKFEFQQFSYRGAELFKLLDAKSEYSQAEVEAIISKIIPLIERVPQDPVFIFESGRVKEFSPAQDGITVNFDSFKNSFLGNLRQLETSEDKEVVVDIPVTRTAPKLKTEDVNNLGIKELIGRGSSRFVGSIPNRIYNIRLASSKFKGILLGPGDVLSFNDIVGDVSESTGFKQAYIIKDGKTVLGDGGGVCQVSTTLFRAALNAGLPIIERVAHAYRVGYYEQDSPPGFDATVYSPSVDLKIKNNTPGHILIQANFDPKTATLVFEIYGTKDGRVVKISKPQVTDSVAPPPDLYQDDPSLALGKIKQIDYAAWGAKVSFNYTVAKAGELPYKKTFVSNYRPWQAVYLRGTGPAN